MVHIVEIKIQSSPQAWGAFLRTCYSPGKETTQRPFCFFSTLTAFTSTAEAP